MARMAQFVVALMLLAQAPAKAHADDTGNIIAAGAIGLLTGLVIGNIVSDHDERRVYESYPVDEEVVVTGYRRSFQPAAVAIKDAW